MMRELAVADVVPALLRELIERLARIERRLDTGGKGPRDAADLALLSTIARTAGGRGFTATHLLEHARVTPELAGALEAADLTTGPEVGEWCKRLRDIPAAGFVLTRGRKGRCGHLWQVVPA